MAKINQHVSDLRGLIKQHGRNPDVYTDGFLYSLLNGARNTLLEQSSNKKNFTSQWDLRWYPIRLVPDKSHLINCVTVGCDILRSEYPIPRALTTNIKSEIKIGTFDYSSILLVTEDQYDFNKYDDIKSKVLQASLINNYLVIWNSKKLKSVLVQGIWENVLDWATIPQCNNNGTYTVNTCFDAREQDFPMSDSLKLPAYEMVLSKLGLSLKLMSDHTNDANNDIR